MESERWKALSLMSVQFAPAPESGCPASGNTCVSRGNLDHTSRKADWHVSITKQAVARYSVNTGRSTDGSCRTIESSVCLTWRGCVRMPVCRETTMTPWSATMLPRTRGCCSRCPTHRPRSGPSCRPAWWTLCEGMLGRAAHWG